MRSGPRPPAFARRLLAIALPPDARAELLHDLDEEFSTHRVPDEGVAAARQWYRSQVLRSVPHGLVLRLSTLVQLSTRGIDRDLRFATRTLRRSPGLSSMVVGSLGAGISACAVAWGVVDGIILRPFPYPEPEWLIAVVVDDGSGRTDFIENVSAPEFLDIRRRSRTLERFYAFGDGDAELETPAGTIAASTTLGWGDPFSTLDVQPLLGRGFMPHELEPVGADVMILSHRIWVRDFGADSSIVGDVWNLSRHPREIVGVMPPGVLFHDADVWRPAGSPPARRARGPRRPFQIVARIRSGFDLGDVNRELGEISSWMAATYAQEHATFAGTCVPRDRG